MQASVAAILMEQMQVYFDSLYHADPTRLASLFHKEARYVNATPGHETSLGIQEYLSIVADREAPAKRREARNERVVSLSFAGTDLALIHAEMAMMGRQYFDCLTLVRENGEWLIMSKIFQHQRLV